MLTHNIIRSILFLLMLIFFNNSISIIRNDDVSKEQEFSPYSEEIPGSDISIEFSPIRGGTYMMGSSEDDPFLEGKEGPRREVKVNSFWMGTYEITWEQYNEFLKEKESNLENLEIILSDGSKMPIDGVSTATPMYIDMSFGMGRDGYPAINMTHYAAMMYAKWLSAKTGNFYRLPTEAEWEYACRAGSTTPYHFGKDSGDLGKYAWFKDNSEEGYKKVGTKLPNALGLHDMHGNVEEWTADQYFDDYHEKLKGKPANNPYFKPTTLYPRSVRGGSWMDDGAELCCTNRRGSSKQWKKRDPQMPKSNWWLTDAPFVGFRLVRPKENPSRDEMEKYWIEVMEDF